MGIGIVVSAVQIRPVKTVTQWVECTKADFQGQMVRIHLNYERQDVPLIHTAYRFVRNCKCGEGNLYMCLKGEDTAFVIAWDSKEEGWFVFGVLLCDALLNYVSADG